MRSSPLFLAALASSLVLGACDAIVGLGEEPTGATSSAGDPSATSSTSIAASSSSGGPSTTTSSSAGGGEGGAAASTSITGSGGGGGQGGAGGAGGGGGGGGGPPACGPIGGEGCVMPDDQTGKCLVRRFTYPDTCVDYSINSFLRGLVATDGVFAFGRRSLNPLGGRECADQPADPRDVVTLERVLRSTYQADSVAVGDVSAVLGGDDDGRLLTVGFNADEAFELLPTSPVAAELAATAAGHGAIEHLGEGTFLAVRNSPSSSEDSIDELRVEGSAVTDCGVAPFQRDVEAALAIGSGKVAWGGFDIVETPDDCPAACLVFDKCYRAGWSEAQLAGGGQCQPATGVMEHPLPEICQVYNLAIAPGGGVFLKVYGTEGGQVRSESGDEIASNTSRGLEVDADHVFVPDLPSGLLVCPHSLDEADCEGLTRAGNLGLVSEVERVPGGLLVLGSFDQGETVETVLTCVDESLFPELP